MPCKIQIRKNLNSKIEARTDPGFNRALPAAKGIADAVNKDYRVEVVKFSQTSSGEIVRSINIPQSLVDKYYDHELELERKEALASNRDIAFFKGDAALLEQEQREFADDFIDIDDSEIEAVLNTKNNESKNCNI